MPTSKRRTKRSLKGGHDVGLRMILIWKSQILINLFETFVHIFRAKLSSRLVDISWIFVVLKALLIDFVLFRDFVLISPRLIHPSTHPDGLLSFDFGMDSWSTLWLLNLYWKTGSGCLFRGRWPDHEQCLRNANSVQRCKPKGNLRRFQFVFFHLSCPVFDFFMIEKYHHHYQVSTSAAVRDCI